MLKFTKIIKFPSTKVFDAEVVVALQEDEARLPLESGEGARAWAARCPAHPPDVLPAHAAHADCQYTRVTQSLFSCTRM